MAHQAFLGPANLGEAFSIALPPWLLYQAGGAPVWAWLALPLVLAAGLAIGRVVGWLAYGLARRSKNPQSRPVRLVNAVRRPGQLVLGIGLFRWGRNALPLSDELAATLGYLELAAATAAFVWLLLRATGFVSDHLSSLLARRGKSQASAMMPLLRKVVKSAVVLLGIIFLLQNAGFNVGAILAGLGIGGLALALAGQKTVENLFGGIALAVDQPARVGDFCKFGGSGGTIEDIGLRSTRIRTPDKTLLTIPNSKLSEMQIENFASRGRILLSNKINLSLDTDVRKLRAVVSGIRDILKDRPDIEGSGRVRLVGITTTSLEVEIYAYVETRDGEKYLQAKEEILFAVMELLGSERAALATTVPPASELKEPERPS